MKFILSSLLLTASLLDAESTDNYTLRLNPFTPDNHFVSDEWFNRGGSPPCP